MWPFGILNHFGDKPDGSAGFILEYMSSDSQFINFFRSSKTDLFTNVASTAGALTTKVISCSTNKVG